MKRKSSNVLALAIVAAAVVLALALVYLGQQLAQRPDEARVQALIDERLSQPLADSVVAELSAKIEKEIAGSIDKQVGKRKGSGLSEEEFNARVERGIMAFVEKTEKHRRAEQDQQESQLQQQAKNVPPPDKNDHLYGNPEAPVTLIEYSDFECPYCKRFHGTAKQLVDASNGRLNWVYRHFPLEMHNPGAQKQAEASECAAELGGNDAFWKYSDTIYTRTRSNGRGFPIENLSPLAVEIGLDKTAFERCLSSGKYARRVDQQLSDGMRAGINGTPGNILYQRKTGKVIALHGAQPLDRFRAALDTLATSAP